MTTPDVTHLANDAVTVYGLLVWINFSPVAIVLPTCCKFIFPVFRVLNFDSSCYLHHLDFFFFFKCLAGSFNYLWIKSVLYYPLLAKVHY